MDVVASDLALPRVHFQSSKDVKLRYAVELAADVFGQCSYQHLEVSAAHVALKVRRNEWSACGCHGDEELGWYRISLARFSHSCLFVTAHHQFLATVQNLDVGGLERLAGAALVLISSSGAGCQASVP